MCPHHDIDSPRGTHSKRGGHSEGPGGFAKLCQMKGLALEEGVPLRKEEIKGLRKQKEYQD